MLQIHTKRSTKEAHKDLVNNMGLTDIHFDAITENLVETLKELNVSQENIDEVVPILGAVAHRNHVLNRW